MPVCLLGKESNVGMGFNKHMKITNQLVWEPMKYKVLLANYNSTLFLGPPPQD